VETFAAKLPVWQRMAHHLRTGPATAAALATALGAPVKSIEKAVFRGQNRMFTRVPGPDGVTQIALVERRER
jgi:hypothetical protein